ncbi:hypothetical protein BJY52DRAFT_554375 [Lactarius psammicola]|nr:hypothetical protein BJY52DRAFT_554375 [Lactarius psammicola]
MMSQRLQMHPHSFPYSSAMCFVQKFIYVMLSDKCDIWAAWGYDGKVGNSRRWMRAQSGAIEPVWDSSPWGLECDAFVDWRTEGMGPRRLVRAGDRLHMMEVSQMTVSCIGSYAAFMRA